ncbi:hypothetical protein C8R46DRAFT_865613, partial [Mycena filopes]
DGPKQRKRKPRALNRTKHSRESGWRRVGSSHTTEIFQTFEQWRNDYTPHVYETADDLVEVRHLGHPVDRPMDIRARPFIVRWITPDHNAPKAYSGDARPVFRTEYRCRGNCSDIAPSDNGSEDSDVQSESDHNRRPSKSNTKQKKNYKKRTCPQKVVIHVEVYSNDLSKAVIYQRGNHWET